MRGYSYNMINGLLNVFLYLFNYTYMHVNPRARQCNLYEWSVPFVLFVIKEKRKIRGLR